MAWNPAPAVARLREFSREFDRPIVIVFSIERSGKNFHVTTFGETRALCGLANSIGESIANKIADGTIEAGVTK